MSQKPYPQELADLLAAAPRMPLGPGTPDRSAGDRIRFLALPDACRAGLWLRFNCLDESHAVSQELHTPDGSAWHAVMHRREPDAWNSKYWWRKVGNHPALVRLRSEAPALGYAYTTPEAFVDFCERVRGTNTDDERTAEAVQELEWRCLFEHCWR
jgi:hypothetical protein